MKNNDKCYFISPGLPRLLFCKRMHHIELYLQENTNATCIPSTLLTLAQWHLAKAVRVQFGHQNVMGACVPRVYFPLVVSLQALKTLINLISYYIILGTV